MDVDRVLVAIEDGMHAIECDGRRPLRVIIGRDVLDALENHPWSIHTSGPHGPPKLRGLPVVIANMRPRRVCVEPSLLPDEAEPAEVMKRLNLDIDWPEDEPTFAEKGRVVEIGPLRYPVKREDMLWPDDDSKEKLAGKIRYAQCDIQVLTGLDPQTERHVIVHEAFHGVLDHMGYHDLPEHVVDAMTFGALMLIDANPWLFEKVEE